MAHINATDVAHFEASSSTPHGTGFVELIESYECTDTADDVVTASPNLLLNRPPHRLLDVLCDVGGSVSRRAARGIVHPGLDEDRRPACAVGTCDICGMDTPKLALVEGRGRGSDVPDSGLSKKVQNGRQREHEVVASVHVPPTM